MRTVGFGFVLCLCFGFFVGWFLCVLFVCFMCGFLLLFWGFCGGGGCSCFFSVSFVCVCVWCVVGFVLCFFYFFFLWEMIFPLLVGESS